MGAEGGAGGRKAGGADIIGGGGNIGGPGCAEASRVMPRAAIAAGRMEVNNLCILTLFTPRLAWFLEPSVIAVPTDRLLYAGAKRRLHRPMKRSYPALTENIFASASVILVPSCVAAIVS